ncbi:C2H2 finger domain protein [Xylaria sp. FL1777]|nr:C2H2 finger domain protein [Xylaria sp. FL1777]
MPPVVPVSDTEYEPYSSDNDSGTGSYNDLDDISDTLNQASKTKTQKAAKRVAEQVQWLDSYPSDLLDDDLEELLHDGNLHPPEYYQRSMEHFDETSYDRKQYSKNTETLICMAERQWCCFSQKVLGKDDWKRSFLEITFRITYNFLDWHLGQRTTIHGRKKPKMKKRSSLVTFWCAFRLAFERATASKIDDLVDRRRTANAIVELGDKHSLTDDKRENRSMTIADLKLQIETTLNTTEKSFKLGEQRILAVLFLLLLAPAGARPASILQLRFGDIRVVLVRDPNNGPHRLVIKFTLNFTKRYLGPKAAKTFLIPEIIFDPSLFLSPHIFLLGILFRHRAFSADIFNDKPETLQKLNIFEGEHELPLPLKPEIRDKLVFRRADQNMNGYTLSDEPITRGMMTKWVNRIGELLGFEHTTICYSLRYMAGNNMDRNVNVSEALRNLVMDHTPNSDTFQKHYLNRNVCADLWAMHRACEPQQTLVEIATSHGHSRSTRRPANLSAEQSAALNHHPDVVRLKQQLQRLHPDSPKYRPVRLKIQATKAHLRRVEKSRMRKEWTDKQAVEDIERQVQGQGFLQPINPSSRIQPMNPAQQRLVTALARTATYCFVEEPLSTKVLEARQPPMPMELGLAPVDKATQLRNSVLVSYVGEKKLRRCFICIGKALTLPPEDPSLPALCRVFSAPTDTARHFKSVHLSKLSPRSKVVCPVCVPIVKLKHKMHLQNHAELVHGISSPGRVTTYRHLLDDDFRFS